MSAGFVYLMRAENGLVKIGKSGNPARRLGQLANSPVLVELIHQIATDDMGWLEVQLHDRYAAKRVRGEWFRLDAGDVVLLVGIDRQDKPRNGASPAPRPGPLPPKLRIPRPDDPIAPRVVIEREAAEFLARAADSLGMTLNSYCRIVLTLLSRNKDATADAIAAEFDAIRVSTSTLQKNPKELAEEA